MKKGIINASERVLNRSIELKSEKQELGSEDLVIIALQSSIVNKARDIVYLFEASRIQSIEIILRSMLEQYVYLTYILKSDTNLKAKLFILSFNIQKYSRIINTMELMEKSGKYETSGNESIRKKELENIQKNHPEINSIEQCISYLKKSYDEIQPYQPDKKNSNYYEKWYNISGKIGNMKELMKVIEMDDAQYEFMYKLSSMDVHGISAFGNVKVSEDELMLESSLDVKLIETLMTTYLLFSAIEISKYYSTRNDRKIRNYIKQIEINYRLYSNNK